MRCTLKFFILDATTLIQQLIMNLIMRKNVFILLIIENFTNYVDFNSLKILENIIPSVINMEYSYYCKIL